jgi:hypothetical protein
MYGLSDPGTSWKGPIDMSRRITATLKTCHAVRGTSIALGMALALWTTSANAQGDAAEQTPDNAELNRRLMALAAEVDDMKLGDVASELQGRYGFGPSASKVYGVNQGVSFGGYGEALYQNFTGKNENGDPVHLTDAIDYLRQVIYFGYKFDERLLFNSEIEFEHASTGKRGEVSVEFAYVDLLLHRAANARAGLLLMPMGFINELHEPPTFYGALRPETEQVIIPSTWRSNGAGVFGNGSGKLAGFSYRAYLVESLSSVNGENSEAFASSGLRNGRQKGSRALMQNVGVTARVDYEARGVLVGGSLFTAGTAQNDTTSSGRHFTARTTLYEGHIQYRRRGLQARALIAVAHVDEADLINDANGLVGAASVGSRLVGGYLEAGYNVLHSRSGQSTWKVIPYARWEQLNTQDQVPAGVNVDARLKRQILTLGAAVHPHNQVVVKGDYVANTNQAKTGIDQFNLSLGFHF